MSGHAELVAEIKIEIYVRLELKARCRLFHNEWFIQNYKLKYTCHRGLSPELFITTEVGIRISPPTNHPMMVVRMREVETLFLDADRIGN